MISEVFYNLDDFCDSVILEEIAGILYFMEYTPVAFTGNPFPLPDRGRVAVVHFVHPQGVSEQGWS